MISLHRFYFDAITKARVHQWRYGQAMFNHLVAVRPELAEQIRGTDRDPFYVEKLNHPNWDRFVAWLESVWFRS